MAGGEAGQQEAGARVRGAAWRLLALGAGVLALLGWSACVLGASERWVRVAGGGMEVYSGAGEGSAIAAAETTASVEDALSEALGVSQRPARPLRIYIFPSEKSFAPFRISGQASRVGYYLEREERDVIVFRTTGVEMDRVLLHELTHRVLRQRAARLPPWLEEGLCEVFSTVWVAKGEVRAGAPVAAHMALLRRAPWMKAEELAGVEESSAQVQDASRSTVFYAQSWALAHMLYFHPGWRAGLRRLLEDAGARGDAMEAFRRAFGRPMSEAVKELEGWLQRVAFPTVKLGRAGRREGVALRTETLGEEAALRARIELLLDLGRTGEARRVLEEATRRYPASPELAAQRGWILLAEGDYEGAEEEFGRAVAVGSRQAAVHLEYAMLRRRAGGERATILRHLRLAVELDGAYVPALFQLAQEELHEQRAGVAAELLQRATQIEPQRFALWQALAYARHYEGRREAALAAAKTALAVARSEAEARQGEALVEYVSREGAPAEERAQALAKQSGQPGAVYVPPSWERPRGNRTIRGTLRRVECLGERAVLLVEAEGQRWRLEIRDPRQVRIEGEESFETTLVCGEQARQVEAEIRTGEEAGRGTLVGLQFLSK